MKRGVLRTGEGGLFFFMCPGCKETHIVGPSWGSHAMAGQTVALRPFDED